MAELLEIRHLQMLRAIARNARVSDAADQLGLTPSALSHRIREAERRLRVSLFTRLHKRLRLTPVGEYLLQVSERVLTDLERAQADAARMSSETRHIVRMAIESYSTYHWLPDFLRWLHASTPDIELQVMKDARRHPLASLRNRHIDLAVIESRSDAPGIQTVALFQDEVVYIMPPVHRHAQKSYIETADLANETYITYALTPMPDREFARVMRPAGMYPSWAVPVELPEAIIELVAAGLGTSALARWAVASAVQAGRRATARITQAGLAVRWSAAMRQEDAVTGPVRQLADALSEWCKRNPAGFGQVSAAPG